MDFRDHFWFYRRSMLKHTIPPFSKSATDHITMITHQGCITITVLMRPIRHPGVFKLISKTASFLYRTSSITAIKCLLTNRKPTLASHAIHTAHTRYIPLHIGLACDINLQSATRSSRNSKPAVFTKNLSITPDQYTPP